APASPAPAPLKPRATEITLPPRGEIGHPPSEPEQRSGWNPDPGILSAKELAQAFQLDFNPQQEAPPRRRLVRGVLTFLVLALIGFTGLMLLWTDLREQTFAWAGRTTDSIQHYIASRTKKPDKSAELATPAPDPARVRATV